MGQGKGERRRGKAEGGSEVQKDTGRVKEDKSPANIYQLVYELRDGESHGSGSSLFGSGMEVEEVKEEVLRTKTPSQVIGPWNGKETKCSCWLNGI